MDTFYLGKPFRKMFLFRVLKFLPTSLWQLKDLQTISIFIIQLIPVWAMCHTERKTLPAQ